MNRSSVVYGALEISLVQKIRHLAHQLDTDYIRSLFRTIKTKKKGLLSAWRGVGKRRRRKAEKD